MDDAPRLSIVIGGSEAWPELRGVLDVLHPQAEALGAEIIVADGSGRALPEDTSDYPRVRRIELRGASPYRLRALGLAEARGEIVAVTEDHCRVRKDWCQRVLQAHQEHPEAAAIGGVVENGATASLIDWATFFVANGAFLAPIPTGSRERVSGQANISYKRRALPRVYPAEGMVEARFQMELRAQREEVLADDRIVVDHVQSLGFRATCINNFHNGRSIGGFDRVDLSTAQRLGHGALGLLLPFRVLKDTVRIVLRIWKKGRLRGTALASAPLIALVIAFHGAGQSLGTLFGPGSSPEHMR